MEQLGIQPIPLLMQVINITILILVLNKFLYKPILTLVEERRKKIREGLELKDKLEEQQNQIDELRRKKLLETRKEARKIIKEAREQAKVQQQQILKSTEEKVAELYKKAEEDIKRQKLQIQQEAKALAVELAEAMAVKALDNVLQDNKTQHKLIKNKIAALQDLVYEE